jgi:predicted glycosyltransferase
MEILDAGTRAVLVPFADGGETEQTLRATILAEQGRLQVVAASTLSADALAAAVDRAWSGPLPARGAVDLGGAQCTAALLAEWMAHR